VGCTFAKTVICYIAGTTTGDKVTALQLKGAASVTRMRGKLVELPTLKTPSLKSTTA
jgi:hypothetical protein